MSLLCGLCVCREGLPPHAVLHRLSSKSLEASTVKRSPYESPHPDAKCCHGAPYSEIAKMVSAYAATLAKATFESTLVLVPIIAMRPVKREPP